MKALVFSALLAVAAPMLSATCTPFTPARPRAVCTACRDCSRQPAPLSSRSDLANIIYDISDFVSELLL